MPVVLAPWVCPMSRKARPWYWNTPIDDTAMPEMATIAHTRSIEADSRIETNAGMAITTYISAVYSPASKLAGFRPHRLIPGAIDNAVDNSDTITTMAAVTRMK